MAEEVKKISFGFSKSVKKSTLKVPVPQEQKKIDYIECVDEKAIKVIGVEEKKDDGPLIIPMRGSKTWHERIVNKIDVDIYEPKPKSLQNEGAVAVQIKEEPREERMEVDDAGVKSKKTVIVKQEVEDKEEQEAPKTLEEQAAREILQDLQSSDTNGDKPNLFSLPLNENTSLVGEKESTLEDYENIPIDAYGMAMLRGMGWKPGKGIGKNEKLVEASVPALRPKGMGLGADTVKMQKQNGKPKTKEEEDLKLVKGAFVKMVAGKRKDSYGQIEGLDDDAGRFIVKMALGGNVVSINESVVQAVTKEDYLKNGKVLNSAKYQEYKNKDNTESDGRSPVVELPDSEREERGRRSEKKENKDRCSSGHDRKKLKKHRRQSTSDNSSPERRSRKRKSSESSEAADKKPKKSKKSKKHRNRDSSAERSSRKNRKKDKEREKRKDKRHSESPDRRKHKKHKRSKSRSPKR